MTQVLTQTQEVFKIPDYSKGNNSTHNVSFIIESLRSHNGVVEAKKGLQDDINELSSRLKSLNDEVTELMSLKIVDAVVEEHRMVGQVYYLFQEQVMKEVFGQEDIPLYTIADMEECFEEDIDEEDGIFKNEEQKLTAMSKWDNIKERIGWNGSTDIDTIASLEEHTYGFTEQRLTIEELENALDKAKKVNCFSAIVTEKLERLVKIYQKLF